MLRNQPHTIDLHSHTHFSDGALGVSELADYAAENGVQHLAITDHDCVDAHVQLAAMSSEQEKSQLAVNVIPGVEISAGYNGREIHIVGLDIDITNQSLVEFLGRQQNYRRERLLKYASTLVAAGVPDVSKQVDRLVASAPTRLHLAQILVAEGVVKDINQAFKKLIGRKAKAYVKAKWPDLDDVIQVIIGAGGIPVLAHPSRYELSRSQLRKLMEWFTDAGGQAVELGYPNADAALINWLSTQAQRLELLSSQGADFHNPEQTWSKPGRFTPVPASVPSVIERLNLT